MNREIKFRAWLVEEKRMIQWNPDFFSDTSPVTGYSDYFPDNDDYVVLMQYTGRKDVHGKEIYEGDIIAHITTNKLVELAPKGDFEYVWHVYDLAGVDVEVIGNIYEKGVDNEHTCK